MYGQLSDAEIRDSLIYSNPTAGILLGTGIRAKILRNNITKNGQGLICISCDPLVDENIIHNNKKNGIVVQSIKDYVAFGTFTRNQITSNVRNGILCIGGYVFSKIYQNSMIGMNLKAGICLKLGCHVGVVDNFISRNCDYFK